MISEGKWNSIIETRNADQNLTLEDIEFNDYNVIIDEATDTLYYSLINYSQNKYNPSMRYKASTNNVKIAVLEDEITDEKIKSNYQFKIMIYNDKQYHIYNLKCTDLPLLNITYREVAQNKQKSIPMEIYLFDNLSNTPNKITKSLGRLRVNEAGYTFSLNKITPGNNIRDNKISILKMKPNHQYILTPVNNNEQAPRNYRVELFINGEYKGVYSLGHTMEKEIKPEI